MKIFIVTLFPEMFEGPFAHSMIWKARERKLAQIELVNLRDFGLGSRKTVDDTPYGGGAGMVLKPEPVFAAVESVKKKAPKAKVIMMSPRGKKLTQLTVKLLSKESDLIILCGHYEGFDERIMEIVDQEISIGDYVLTGGELPAMVLVDSVVRLIPGVLGDKASPEEESFSQGLLEYPQYTRPDEFRGMKVPEILKGGNHVEIKRWRTEQSVVKTKANRADLTDF
ncbi:tRNA (guanosine(37)-N1)-methyltransferase TrmD [Candidatus Saccharibacteria bacterium]|nr:tRNA (guanosine(37)-N1)-methyltransferase TrmD [Candidatus Saccharibacteria bacterium]